MDTRHLDAAVDAVKTADRELSSAPNDDVDPSDLSAQIAAVRALMMTIDHHVLTIAKRYGRFGVLRHDKGGDPDATVNEVTARLDAILDRFVTVDDDFRIAHDNAAHLAQL